MPVSTGTPYDLLGGYPDRTRPLVTHYDGADSRIELSVASVANAVAKAASMLRDGLGLPPGAVVSIDLPRHWQLPVWVMAALSVGATVGRDLAAGVSPVAPVDVRIVGPQGLAAILGGADPGADEVLACSCDAFGLPVAGGVPAGVIDVGLEVRAHPDQFSAEPDAGRTAALLVKGLLVRWAEVASIPGPQPGARLWVDEDTGESVLLHAVAIEPLLVRGSVVIGTGLEAERAARIRATESVMGRAGQ
jgi:uncharacterized protein (TIGR03089 family)